jgi:predicted helicase
MEVGYYVGGMKQAELDKSAKKKVIVSTYAMSSEGMNIKSLNTLILATPKSDIVQSVGRILRLKPEERVIKPLVIDMIDGHDALNSSVTQRLRFYRKNGYSINNFTYSKGKKTFIGKDQKGKRKKKKKIEICEMNECMLLED